LQKAQEGPKSTTSGGIEAAERAAQELSRRRDE
jgi:hypothetical protein